MPELWLRKVGTLSKSDDPLVRDQLRTSLIPDARQVSDDGVVLLHGIARSARAMGRLEQALRADGYRTLNLDYPARRHDIATLAEQIDVPVRRFGQGLSGKVHFVTHSMGGLVARALITRYRPDKLGRVVMLGPPNQGSEIADRLARKTLYRRIFGPAGAELTTWAQETWAQESRMSISVDFPLGVIAGDRGLDPICWMLLPKPNDGKVTVARTKIDGMADHVTLPVTHALMMRDPAVIRATLAFLRDGRFPADLHSPAPSPT